MASSPPPPSSLLLLPKPLLLHPQSLLHLKTPPFSFRPRPITLRHTPPHSTPFPTSPASLSAVDGLFDFICDGPLIPKLGITPEDVSEKIDLWLRSGIGLCRLFKMDELRLNPQEKARIYHYYVPVFVWCEEMIRRHREGKEGGGDELPPLVIGVSAPQGSGKTTLVFALNYLFQQIGRNSATLSIDDFYLKAEDQAKLRDQNPGNALLEFRGNAGSHDLHFSIDTLKALIELKSGMKMTLPRYDKSAYGGRGDRADPSLWPQVEGPLSVILFEGWMLGFKHLPSEAVKAVNPQLEVVNENLLAYHDAWNKFIEAWIIIKIKDPTCVYQWRLEAEHAMRQDGKPGMSDEEVNDFVSRYLPAYKAYLPILYSEGPKGADKERLLVIEVDEQRNPIC